MDISSFMNTVNRKCDTCGKLISTQPYETVPTDEATLEFCSEWCLHWQQGADSDRR